METQPDAEIESEAEPETEAETMTQLAEEAELTDTTQMELLRGSNSLQPFIFLFFIISLHFLRNDQINF
jgi:hypothetical protein